MLSPGLWVHRGPAPAMREFHRHDDIELNVVLRGSLDYLFGGGRLIVPAGHSALFWAAAPHRLIGSDPQPDSDICWIHLPLQTVLQWDLPASFASRTLAQRTVIVPSTEVAEHLEQQFGTWQRELAEGRDQRPLLLDAHALVLRILAASDRAPSAGTPTSAAGPGVRHDLRPVAAMARFVAERFRDPISSADIARSAGLNPNYATTVFRESIGIPLGEHLLRHRIAEAQRLLITTTWTTTDIAYAAGFGSPSSFYAHFSRACGCAPGAYRASRRWSAPEVSP